MQIFDTFFFWVLTACTLWQGSLAGDRQSAFVCLIDEPIDNECATFCLQGVEAKLEGQLQKVQTQLEGQLLAVQTKVEESQAKLEESLRAVQTGLNQLQEVLSKLENPNKSQEVAKIKVSDSDRNNIPSPDSKKIGTRYLRVISGSRDRDIGKKKCKELGGHLNRILEHEEILLVVNTVMKGCRNAVYRDGIWEDYCTNSVYFVCEGRDA